MLRIVFAGMAVATVVANGQAARATEGPWCAILNFGTDVSEDCQYRTFEECVPHVTAGFRGFCNHNPRWPGAVEEPRHHRKRATKWQ